MPLALFFSTHIGVHCSTTEALPVLKWVPWHMVYLKEQPLAVVPTFSHLLNHLPARAGRAKLHCWRNNTTPNNPNRPSQTQHHSISQTTVKGENDILIEISERPANTITKTLFQTSPWAPSAVITDYWRLHCVVARSSYPAVLETRNGISLPKTRPDSPLAAGTMSKSCLRAVPTLQPAFLHGQPPCSTISHTNHLQTRGVALVSRALQAVTLPVSKKLPFAR